MRKCQISTTKLGYLEKILQAFARMTPVKVLFKRKKKKQREKGQREGFKIRTTQRDVLTKEK